MLLNDMNTLVLEDIVLKKPVVRPFVKKRFEDAVAECNGISVEVFIDELRRRVKERYSNAKS